MSLDNNYERQNYKKNWQCQMGFDNTSEKRITQEMTTEYHKKGQDRISSKNQNNTTGYN